MNSTTRVLRFRTRGIVEEFQSERSAEHSKTNCNSKWGIDENSSSSNTFSYAIEENPLNLKP